MPQNEQTDRRPRFSLTATDAFVLLGALTLYLALAQTAFYATDGHGFVAAVQRGRLWNDSRHPLYVPIVAGLHALLRPFGIGPFAAARAASALGSALGVWCMYRAALAAQERTAFRVACACAVTPAVVFFATVVEIHGVFLAFAGLCWWLIARREPVGCPAPLSAALVLGTATAVAAHVHATGHLLPALLLPWWYAARIDLTRRCRFRFLVASAVTHAAVCAAALPVFYVLDVPAPWRDQWHHVAPAVLNLGGHDPTRLATLAVSDWLLAFAPFSMAPLLGLWVADAARRATALAWGIALYVALTWVLVQGTERGAYAVPLVWPACALVARSVPRGWCWLAVLGAVTLSLSLVRTHDHAPGDPNLVADLRAACGDARPAVLAANPQEAEWLLRESPDLIVFELWDWLMVNRAGAGTEPATLAGVLDDHLLAGHALCMGAQTAVGLMQLEGSRARLLWRYLSTEFAISELRHGTFRGIRLRHRGS